MVVIDHIFHLIWKRKSAPWGSFRTPRPFILLLTNVIFLLFIVILHSAMTLFRFVKARISTVM